MSHPITYAECQLPSCNLLALSWLHPWGKYCSPAHRDQHAYRSRPTRIVADNHQRAFALQPAAGDPVLGGDPFGGKVGDILAMPLPAEQTDRAQPLAERAAERAQEISVAAAPLIERVLRWIGGLFR